MSWEGRFNDDNCDLGRKFDPKHCQFLHYRAKNREGYDPCLFCPLIIEYIKKERGEYTVTKTRSCLHCKEEKKIVGRGLCSKCYFNPEIKEKYPPKGPPVGKKTEQKTEENKNSGTNAADFIAKCDSCGLLCERNEMVLAGERIVCNSCIDTANQPAPETKMPSIQAVEKRGRNSICLQPLEDLLADRRQYLEELRRQASEQNRLLDMKLFQVQTFEKLCQDLQTTIERMKR